MSPETINLGLCPVCGWTTEFDTIDYGDAGKGLVCHVYLGAMEGTCCADIERVVELPVSVVEGEPLCGDQCDPIGLGPSLVCTLLHGHAGMHADDRGTHWTPSRPPSDRRAGSPARTPKKDSLAADVARGGMDRGSVRPITRKRTA